MFMEQQAVTNPAVIHGLCAMTKHSEINTALLAQARPLMMNHLTSSLLGPVSVQKMRL